jgi:glyoxylase-like metal-dependent hydrolase (beta-lactamase superfamily II)
MFLSTLGRGTFAVAIFGAGIAACSDDTGNDGLNSRSETTAGSATSSTTDATPTTAPAPTTSSPLDSPEVNAVSWERVNLGFVSAYVLSRSGEAAIVDTGVGGSAAEIEAALGSVGLGWEAVGHVILTHSHGDHIGSIADVLEAAPAAQAYAGAEDIPQINAPRELIAVSDGDSVFGLAIVATPGHTPGHISVLDVAGRVLLAGDALNGGDAVGGEAGTIAGANPQFTADIVVADDSVRKLAGLDIETILFGHGQPIESDAGAQLTALAASI